MTQTGLAGKRSVTPARRVWGRKPLAQVIAIALAAAGSPLWAGPAGEHVVAGEATISRPDATRTLIHQSSRKAAIDWQNFNIGAAESVRFDQPSASSVVLNRVLGQSPTEVLGALSANGQVFVLNPNGVLFGAGARVDVGGLVASTLNLRTEDFMAGRMQFAGEEGASGEVRNAGHIVADGGYVALAGQRVGNEGRIVAADVALAAGEKIDLKLAGSRLVSISVDRGAIDALADNRGLIRAEGGQVLLTAKGADHLIKSVVNNSGVVEAATLRNVDGRIRLEGDVVDNSGTLSARGGDIAIAATNDVTLAAGSCISTSGTQGGDIDVQARHGTLIAGGRIEAVGSDDRGGKIALLGERVALVDGATVDASGATGGGTVLVGGDYQGSNATVQNAGRTHVAATASIRADAVDTGNGGKVVVWADGDTRYRGAISARGGAAGGNGGLVEVSGKQQLEMLGRIDVAAPNGVGGNVLLDPQNIVLNNSTQAPPPNNANGSPDVLFADAPASGNYQIQIADVTGYNELYLQATNNITVSNTMAMGSGNSVRFEAGNAIAINAALTASGGVNLSAAAITSTSAGAITSTGAANTNAGNISINATGNVNLAGNLTASGGTASASAGRAGGTISIAGASVALGAATITASGSAGSGATQAGGAGGTISITATNGITGTGAMTASGGNGGTGIAAGGAAGTIVLANSNAGNMSVGALSARSGNALTTGAGGAAGSISVTNSAVGGTLATGALTTTGGNNGHGGTVAATSAGALTTGAIATGGGTALAGTAGRNAGTVTLIGDSVSTGAGTITASGSAGVGTSQSGGNGANVSISALGNSGGGVTTGAINASGGTGTTSLANGGSAGSITVANNSTTTGAIALGALTSNSGAAFGAGAGGVAGAVQVTNLAVGQGLTTGAITANGGTNSNGANVSLSSQGDATVSGLITTNGGARTTGTTAAGTSAGTISISGNNRSVTGAITAIGGAGLGTNQAGGNAGTVSITGSGALTTVAISSQTGAATGTGAGGTTGGIALTGSNIGTGALATTGGANAHGAAITVNATGTLATGAIATGGGTAGAGTSGRNAGDITLSAGGAITGVGIVTASGSAGVLTGDQAGGNGGIVSITSGGGVTTAAITASGGAAAGTNAAGGNAGMIAIDNSGAGHVSTGALAAQTGAATGTGAGGTAGFVAVVNTAAGGNLTTGAINTSGGTKGHGGSIGLSALGAVSTGAAGNITSAGGTTITGNAGRNAGAITLSGDSVSTGTGTITATGSAGIGANQNGGNGADVQIATTGAITTGAINTAGGAGITTLANGGNAGSIVIANNSTTAGAISLGALTTSSGAAFGTGTGGIAGSVQITNLAAGQGLTTGAITANGGTNSDGANVSLSSQGNATVSGLVTTSGGARGAGSTAAGTNAGSIAISGINRSVSGAITAVGGAGLGTNQAGGNAGTVSITGSGTLSTGAINSQTGAATGTGAGGTAGGIALSGSTVGTGVLTTTGALNAHGGAVAINATGALTTGAIATGGGTASTGTAGRNAGAVTLTGDSVSTGTGTITASGSAGVGTSQNGGNGANVSITALGNSGGGVATGAINTSGGAGTTSLANGGNAGSITVANNSTTTGAIALGALTSNSGAAFGTGTGGIAGAVQLTNLAAGQGLTTGAIAANGGTNSSGANVSLSSQGNATVSGLINTNGGARGTGVTAAGTNAGNIAISGVNRSVTGAITAVGGAGLGTNQAGGNAGTVSITGSGTLNTVAISSQTGAATGTGAGGAVGGIALTGSTIAAGALTTTGGASGNGGNIAATSSAGNLSVGAIAANGGTANTNTAGRNAGTVSLNSAGQLTASTIAASGSAGNGASRAGGTGGAVTATAADNISVGAITANGGAAGASGNANGGAAGNISLDAGGATPTIALGGNIAATGGNRIGTGIAGAGGNFRAYDAIASGATMSIGTAGGTGGAGGSLRIDGALNEDASARTLTLAAGTGAITLAGGAATNALTTLSATGSSIALGSVQTKGAQSYTGATSLNGALSTTGTAGADTIAFNSPVTLTGNSSLTTAGGSGDNIAIGQTVNGNFRFALDAGALGTVSTSAIIGGSSALAAFSANGSAVTFGRSVTAGSIFARSGTGDIALNTGGTVLTGTGTGNAVELVVDGVAGRFVNNVGSGAINASNAAGRFLVWSQSPTGDTRGGLAFGFKQYGATYDATTVADGNPNNNGFLYAVAPVITTTLTGNVAKTYNGNDIAALTAGNYSFSGAIDGDTVAVNGPTAANYVDKHAGSAKAVTASGFAIDSASNGAVAVYGYTLASDSATANIGTINQRALTVSAVADSKVYNGSTASIAAPTHAALQGTDTADFSQSFDNRNVGTGKTLAASGVVDDGNGGANYSYTFVDSNGGVITPAALTVTAQADSRGYNGTVASSIAPIVSGTLYDSVDTAAIQQFANKHAGGNKTLNASGLVIDDGNGGNNYTISYVADHTGAISRAALTVTAQADSRGYNGTTASSVGPVVSGTLYDGVGTAASQRFANKHAGSNKALHASGLVMDDGNDGDNYAISYVANNTGSISRAALTVTAQADSRGYNGSTASSVGPVVSGTLYDSIGAAATQQFANKHAGSNKILNASGLVMDDGNDGDNYDISYVANNTGSISRAALTVTAQADSRGYDGTTASSVAPIVSGTLYDSIDTAAIQQFANKHAGSNKTLNASGLLIDDGNSGNNYSIAYVASNSGAIAKAALHLAATSDTKVYDATRASGGAVAVTGLQGGDTVAGATQQFASRNVRGANGSTLQVAGFTLDDGNGGDNYDVTFGTATGTISPATISGVTGIVARDKVYDAIAGAELDTGAAILHGLLGTDAVSATATGSFSDRNAGIGKTVSIGGIALTGSDAGNYVLADTTATTVATIHRREIAVVANDATKIYGNRDPLLGFRIGGAGLAGNETIADVFTGTLVRAAGENVLGGPYAIREGTLAANANYVVAAFTPGRMTITPRPLTIRADDKTGAVATSLPPFTATYEGFAFADNAASLDGMLVMTVAADAMSRPGTYVIAPSGQSAGNYAITYVAGALRVTPGRAQAMDTVLPAIYSANDWSPQISDTGFAADKGETDTAEKCGASGDGAGTPCTAGDRAEQEPQLGAMNTARPARGFAL